VPSGERGLFRYNALRAKEDEHCLYSCLNRNEKVSSLCVFWGGDGLKDRVCLDLSLQSRQRSVRSFSIECPARSGFRKSLLDQTKSASWTNSVERLRVAASADPILAQ
jgi:hypothetical protein